MVFKAFFNFGKVKKIIHEHFYNFWMLNSQGTSIDYQYLFNLISVYAFQQDPLTHHSCSTGNNYFMAHKIKFNIN